MEEELLLKLLGNIGFPAVICLYTLFGVNKTLKELTAVICLYTLFGVNKTLKELTAAITKLATDVDRRISKLEDRFDNLRKGD